MSPQIGPIPSARAASARVSPLHASVLSPLLALLLSACVVPSALARQEASTPVAAPASQAQRYTRIPAERIDLGRLISDVQKMQYADNKAYMTFWLPEAFWARAMLESGADASDPITKLAVSHLEKFILVIAIRDEAVNKTGADSMYASYRALVKDIRLIDAQGRSYTPIPEKKLDPIMSEMMTVMRPQLAQMAGDLGEGMHIFIFPAEADDGSPIADAYSDGHLTIAIGDVQNRYRLPLGSLIVPQVDSATGEQFPGDYRFNPYTGSPLQAVPQQTPGKQGAPE